MTPKLRGFGGDFPYSKPPFIGWPTDAWGCYNLQNISMIHEWKSKSLPLPNAIKQTPQEITVEIRPPFVWGDYFSKQWRWYVPSLFQEPLQKLTPNSLPLGPPGKPGFCGTNTTLTPYHSCLYLHLQKDSWTWFFFPEIVFCPTKLSQYWGSPKIIPA